MDVAIWFVIIVWLPLIWYRVGYVADVLKEIRDILKMKGGDTE